MARRMDAVGLDSSSHPLGSRRPQSLSCASELRGHAGQRFYHGQQPTAGAQRRDGLRVWSCGTARHRRKTRHFASSRVQGRAKYRGGPGDHGPTEPPGGGRGWQSGRDNGPVSKSAESQHGVSVHQNAARRDPCPAPRPSPPRGSDPRSRPPAERQSFEADTVSFFFSDLLSDPDLLSELDFVSVLDFDSEPNGSVLSDLGLPPFPPPLA